MDDTKLTEKRRIPCLVYSRIVGYLTAVQGWHDAKQQEFKDRRVFVLPKSDDEKPTE